MVRESLIDGLPPGGGLPELVLMPDGIAPEEAAAGLSASVVDRLGSGPEGPPAFDIVLLGLGEDCHTASLFPDSPLLQDRGLFVAVHDSPKPPPDRVSMTIGLLAAARARVILATGSTKAAAAAALVGAPDPSAPASLLPASGSTLVTDPEAAELVTGATGV